MSQSNSAPFESTEDAPRIGHVYEDQRTGERRLIIYVDDRVVLSRDESGHTTLTPRGAFDASLGTRYRIRPDARLDVDGGQYDRLRQHLAEYESRDGRRADHKTDALREALDVVAATAGDTHPGGSSIDGAGRDEPDGGDSGDARQVDFESISGIGPETARKLRAQGFVTASDVHAASDEDLLAVSGVGPTSLEHIRDFLQ